MSIGNAVEQMSREFPDLSVSKIRFLESEGLLSLKRTPSGYRRFSQEDLTRLRRVLLLQKEQHLPLKVIRERLAAEDAAGVTQLGGVVPLVGAEQMRPAAPALLTDKDVADTAGVDVEFVREMTKLGVIRADSSGFFTQDDARTVATACQLHELGVDLRMLKTLRLAAQRQADVISQVAQPVAHSRDDSAKERALEFATELSALVISLHAGIVKQELRGQFG
ncbi:MerR family transcriptional regulator [Corynebacterium sp. 13CS0277]|nr:MerR family transcriptional regulator [Corynebacterium sp. 13CS0277]